MLWQINMERGLPLLWWEIGGEPKESWGCSVMLLPLLGEHVLQCEYGGQRMASGVSSTFHLV